MIERTGIAENKTAKVKTYKTLSQKQGKVLSRALLISGGSFIGIGIVGFALTYLFGWILSNAWMNNPNSFAYEGMLIASVVIILVTMIGSMIVMGRATKSKTSTLIVWMVIYSLGQAIGFAMLLSGIAALVYLIGQAGVSLGFFNPITDCILVFVVCGVLFCLCAAIGYGLSAKAAFRLMKFMGFAYLAMFVLSICMIIPCIIFLVNPSQSGSQFFEWYTFLIYAIFALMFMFYITWDVNVIAKSAMFMNYEDNKLETNMAIYYGYKLLVDLMGLLWIAMSMMLRVRGARRF